MMNDESVVEHADNEIDDQQNALANYFSSLLSGEVVREPASNPEPEPATETEAQLAEDAVEARSETKDEVVEATHAAAVAEAAAADEIVESEPESGLEPESNDVQVAPQAERSTNVATAEKTAQSNETAEPATPEMATESMTVLSFRVQGLTLAIPLKDFSGVQVISEELEPVESELEWFVGELTQMGRRVRIIDTYRLTIPIERRKDTGENDSAVGKTLILFNKGQYGMLCDERDSVQKINGSDINWTTASSKRPWLAATVPSKCVAIMNIDQIIKLIKNLPTLV
jgi:purine-binding chemotaxis protein CheW